MNTSHAYAIIPVSIIRILQSARVGIWIIENARTSRWPRRDVESMCCVGMMVGVECQLECVNYLQDSSTQTHKRTLTHRLYTICNLLCKPFMIVLPTHRTPLAPRTGGRIECIAYAVLAALHGEQITAVHVFVAPPALAVKQVLASMDHLCERSGNVINHLKKKKLCWSAYVQIQLSDVYVIEAPRPAVLHRLELIERTELERIQAGQHLDQLTSHGRAGVWQKSAGPTSGINMFELTILANMGNINTNRSMAAGTRSQLMRLLLQTSTAGYGMS